MRTRPTEEQLALICRLPTADFATLEFLSERPRDASEISQFLAARSGSAEDVGSPRAHFELLRRLRACGLIEAEARKHETQGEGPTRFVATDAGRSLLGAWTAHAAGAFPARKRRYDAE